MKVVISRSAKYLVVLYVIFFFNKTETVYNLREENRQLRKAHQDIHVQLQDVKVKSNQAFDCLFVCLLQLVKWLEKLLPSVLGILFL